MIKFLFKGLIRDKNRSLLPIIVVTAGVFLTVLSHAWITGIFEQSIEFNADFSTGHVKIMTNAYNENKDQIPNDLALLNSNELRTKLEERYPEIEWAERILFGGLIDRPDEKGETKAQGPATGYGIDLLSGDKAEIERLNLKKTLKKGHLPDKKGEILISNDFSEKLGADIGSTVTLISSTMYSGMAIYNFTVAGTVEFGTQAMDRGAIIADIGDVRQALDMTDATAELLGYFKTGFYDQARADKVIADFNKEFNDPGDEFSPVMCSLYDQNNLGTFVNYIDSIAGIISLIFIIAMSLVLWNAGLLGGLRRYGEFGVRLAIGEGKSHLYKTLIYESFIIGIIGSVIGSFLGISLSLYLQNHGLDISGMMKNATIMMPSIMRSHVTPASYYIGFVPGVISTTFGSMLAGIGIYKRKTAQLFKELES